MRTQSALIILNILALIGCLAWLMFEGGWEPIVAVIVAISTLIAQLFATERKKVSMKQTGGKGSQNYQAGNDINISSND